jgi:peptidoglycan/LPS O-acetylase OafA/YrhL
MATSQERSAPAAGLARFHRGLALFFLAGAVVQFVIAGYSSFGGTDWEPHRIWGSVLGLIALVLLVLAFVGRREALQPSAVLFGLTILQSILGVAGAEAPAVGALHPLNGLLILAVAMLVAAGRPVRLGPPHRATS